MFQPVDPVAFTLFGRDIYWYGILIAVAIVLAVVLTMWRFKKNRYSTDVVIDLALVLIPCAIIGARLFYVAFEWEHYAADPLSILYVWEGGLAIYGGIIGGVIATLIFCKVRGYKFGVFADSIAPGLALAQGIGRWGNYFNQEAFGYAVRDPRIINFPFLTVRIDRPHYVDGVLCMEPFHLATFFYESVWNIAVFVVLMLYLRKKRPRGNAFALYMLLYGCGRAWIEGLRTDSLWLIPGVVRISQLLSVVIAVAGLGFFLWNSRKGKLGIGPVDDSGLPPYTSGEEKTGRRDSADVGHLTEQGWGAEREDGKPPQEAGEQKEED
ncbi:MAG: prolipoprotein diacylglyceryl transferase, partial [Christensenellales bacterium]